MAYATTSDMEGAASSWPALERALAQFIMNFELRHVTSSVRAAVTTLIQDQLALQIGSSALPWSKQAFAFIAAQQRKGRSTVVASGAAMSAVDAAYINSVYGHAFEYDDTHRASGSHPGCTVVPTALALAEELGSTVDQLVVAIAVGYEVYARLGVLAAPNLVRGGFQAAAVLSSFGAAATAAKLRGLDEEKTFHTISIASSHVNSATSEYTSTGGSIKRFHPANGVRGGILSAELASLGVTGPTAFLSGNKGFFKVLLKREVRAAAENEFSLARPMELHKIWIKPYCACGCSHPYIDAIAPFASRLEDIEKVAVDIQAASNVVVGTLNSNAYTPQNIEHVQFSLPIQMAFALLGHGNAYGVHRDYMGGRLDMNAVRSAARLVELREDPGLDAQFPGKFVAKLTVHFRNGSNQQVFAEDSVGTPENPLPQERLDAKFLDLTVPVMGQSKAQALLAAVRKLEGHRQAADLAALCRL
jgi:2-methylcitrate dehydratase PrpD